MAEEVVHFAQITFLSTTIYDLDDERFLLAFPIADRLPAYATALDQTNKGNEGRRK
jgi:hypothetical protein